MSGIFKRALAVRRCLVPAEAFYEWRTMPDGKQPYAIGRADEAPSTSPACGKAGAILPARWCGRSPSRPRPRTTTWRCCTTVLAAAGPACPLCPQKEALKGHRMRFKSEFLFGACLTLRGTAFAPWRSSGGCSFKPACAATILKATKRCPRFGSETVNPAAIRYSMHPGKLVPMRMGEVLHTPEKLT